MSTATVLNEFCFNESVFHLNREKLQTLHVTEDLIIVYSTRNIEKGQNLVKAIRIEMKHGMF